MIKNYIKIAWRNLTKNRSYALINIGGLAIALAVFIVIILFVRHELSYDQFFSNSDQIFRVLMLDEDGAVNTQLPEPVAGELKELYPEVEQSVRVAGPYRDVLLKGANKLYSDGFANVGSDYFRIFDFNFRSGDPKSALSSPGSIVITESLAQKLFDSTAVLGKTITHNNNGTYTVAGIIKDPPSNTHFSIQAFAYREPYPIKQWNYRTNTTYIKLRQSEQASSLREKLPAYVEEYIQFPEGMVPQEYSLELQPVTDVHMYPQGQTGQSSRWFYIQVLLLVAGLILLVACINYMNMATAQSARRAQEIGIRKTAGAEKRQVRWQVIIESLITCSIAFLCSFLLVELFKPIALSYFDINLSSLYQFSIGWIAFLGGLLIFISVLSGGYAAFYLSSFNPSEVLKGAGLQSGQRTFRLRKALVVTQFSISIAVVIASLLISQQMEFVRTERLDGTDEQILVIRNNSDSLSGQFASFKEELLRHQSISSVSAGTIPNEIGLTSSFADSSGAVRSYYYFNVEYDYLETLGLELVDGRRFDPKRTQDSTGSVILNQTAAKTLGIEKVTGQTINRFRKEVIGIVEDFHAHTLFDPIRPVVMQIINHDRARMNTILVRLNEGQISAGLDHVRAVWDQFVPAYPLNFRFMDQVLDQAYRAELRLARIFNLFSVFSIFIACLGLFGLAAYSAERRTREIGIRKVMGATVTQIVGLLSKDFMKLVLLGFVIAVPIAWYTMHRWLQDFAYRIEIGPGIFLVAGGVAVLIALATVSWQSIRAALANPVESLRSE